MMRAADRCDIEAMEILNAEIRALNDLASVCLGRIMESTKSSR